MIDRQSRRNKPSGHKRLAADDLGDKLFRALQAAGGVPLPEREHRFHPTRKWRFDLAWPAHLVAVELEGGTWTRGRHVRPKGFAADCEKYNAALLLGWRVLRYTAAMLRDTDRVIDEIRLTLSAGP